jgi:hypothetical protein
VLPDVFALAERCVEDEVLLPLVPTAPDGAAPGMMQPVSLISCGSAAAVCDCAERREVV